jgi:hypothetical protein
MSSSVIVGRTVHFTAVINSCKESPHVAKEPDATMRYADAEAKLFRRAKRFNDGQKEMSCDQIIVQHFTGNEENVVIFESGGKRRVGRVRLLMGLQSGSVSTTANFSEAVELLDSDDEKRLLTIYDQLVNASSVPKK